MAPFMKHDLDRKYKKWRRGMSKKAADTNGSAAPTPKGSLKQQLRGKERLLGRLQQQQPQEGPMENSLELLDKLREEIQALRQEMERKQTVEKERQNAVKSHGTRFLERQRLTRMERAIKVGRGGSGNLQGGGSDKERIILQKIALDMVYVAFHPHDVKYQPLFRKGVRVVDDKRALLKRAKTRQRILQDLKGMDDQGKRKVNWISPEHYQRLPQVEEWTVELEREFFGERSADVSRIKGSSLTLDDDDDRFQLDLSQQHAAILAAADQVEAELDQDPQLRGAAQERNDENSSEESSSSSSSSSDDDNDDDDDDSTTGGHPALVSDKQKSTTQATFAKQKSTTQHQGKAKILAQHMTGKSKSISDAADASAAVSEDKRGRSQKRAVENNDGSDDDDDDDMEDEDNLSNHAADENDDDDFLVPAFDEDINAFAKPTAKPDCLPARSNDKSKGWETQRQRPGQFKRRKTRK